MKSSAAQKREADTGHCWDGFRPGDWLSSINVRDFIVRNVTPYTGDEAFLAGPSQRTKAVWAKLQPYFAEERKKGVLAVDAETPSTLLAHKAGYIDRDNEIIVGLQTDQPFKRAIFPYGGLRMVEAGLKAAGFEPRNVAAWETLISAEQAQNLPPKQREGTLREAIRAFQRYPSLEAAYTNRLAASLRARGEGSAAELEENRIVRKNRGDRSDVSVEQARLNLVRIMQTRPLQEQVAAYNGLVDTLGRKGGIAFFDQIVLVFAEHLVQLDQRPEALRAVRRAQDKMEATPDRQLGQEFARLLGTIQAGK